MLNASVNQKKYAKQISEKKSQNKMAFSEIIHSVTPKNVRRPRVGQKGQIPRRISELLKAIRKQTTREKVSEKNFTKK